MSINRKNLRYCEVLYNNKHYDVMIAVSDLDDVNNILQEWSLDTFGEVLDLPEALVQNKDATEIITRDIDSFVYLKSPVSTFMDMPRYAGLSGSLPVFPTELAAGKYVMPDATAYLYSEAGFTGYFGEYSIPTQDFTLSSGINYIGITFNSGSPVWQIYSDDSYFNYSSIIPVITILYFSSNIHVIPTGQTGYGLPEKLLEVQNKRLIFDAIGDFSLVTDTNYIELGQVTVSNGVYYIACPAIDTEVVDNDMYLYYKDISSVWQTTKVTQINNTQYQSTGGGLSALGAGEFVINNVYRVIDSDKKLIFLTLTDKFVDLASATDSIISTDLPGEIKESAVFVGRIIVEKDSTAPAIQKIQKISLGVV
jgi:hypothetical protein